MDWALKSAVEQARLHPGEFSLPPKKDTKTLRPGDFAKLLFAFAPRGHEPGGERMWVQVIQVFECGHYLGKLSNDPLYAPIKLGDEVEFRPEHVLAFMRSETATTGPEDIGWVEHGENDPDRHKKR